jgi:DNA-binding NarL/FixJ family response regulator
MLTAARALCLTQLGRVEEARAVVGPLLDIGGSNDPELHSEPLVLLLQAALVLEHRAAAQALAARLASVAQLSTVDCYVYTCVARNLGDAARLAVDRATARGYYAQALESADKIRFRPELALTHLRMAELLFEEQDAVAHSEALKHLNSALPELRDMKMQLALGRAVALHEKWAPATGVATAHKSASDPLTTREREIAGLLAAGLSNHDVAHRLVISDATVEVHVKHILSKLGFRSRSQVAVWFSQQQPEA